MKLHIPTDVYIQKQLIIAACLFLGNIMAGYSTGWSSPITIKLQDAEQTPLPDVISDQIASWVGSSFVIGAAIGPNISGTLSNIVGRKICLILGATVNILGQTLIALSRHLATLIVGRVVSGFGMGIITVCNIIYIGEIASTNLRGVILTCSGIFHTLGILFVYSVGPYVPYATVSYIYLGIAGLHLLGLIFIPESPLYYVLKGNKDGALKSLKALGREKELDTIISNANQNEAKNTDIKELFTIKSNRKSLLITVAMYILQQSTGVFAAMYFTQTIFEKAGTSIDPSISTIIVGFTQFVGTLIVPTVIEKLGRKTLLLISLGGCFISMTVMGGYFFLADDSDVELDSTNTFGWVPLAAFILSFFSFSIGLNIIPNTFAGEMFRTNVRGIGSSIAFTVGTITGFISTTTFGYMTNSIGEAFTFWIFSIVNVIGFVFTLFVVPETKGMTLTEIEEMLGK